MMEVNGTVEHEKHHHHHKEMVEEFHAAIHDIFNRINTRIKSAAGVSVSEMSYLTDMMKDLSESLCCLSRFSYYNDQVIDHEKHCKEEHEAVL